MIVLEVGARLPTFTVQVDAGSMKVFSLLTADPNPIHWSASAVSRAGLGDRVINQGGLSAAYVVNAVAESLGDGVSILSTRFRFVAKAYAGDVLTGGGEVVAFDDGIGQLAVWLGRSPSELVLTGELSVSTRNVVASSAFPGEVIGVEPDSV